MKYLKIRIKRICNDVIMFDTIDFVYCIFEYFQMYYIYRYKYPTYKINTFYLQSI